MDIFEAFNTVVAGKEVNLNADVPLTDEQIRERNKKYIEEVEKEYAEKMRIRDRGEELDDDYPKRLPDPITLRNPLVDVVSTDKLNFNKNYDPEDFFIRQTIAPEDRKGVQEQIAKLYDAPHQIVDGKKVYHTYYFNIEAWCIELFFEAIDWDAKIVEAVMNPKNTKIQADIAGVGFAKLALAARGKR